MDLYFFPKITVTYFACLLACRLDEIQGAIYTVAAPLLCIITHFCLPFYPMDEGKKIWVKCLSSVLYGFEEIRLAFQHYQNEYYVPLVVELKAMLVGRLDVSSVRFVLSAKNIRYMYIICIYSLESQLSLDIVYFTLIRIRYLECSPPWIE